MDKYLEEYHRQILQEHLLIDDYAQLSKGSAQHKMDSLKQTLKTMISNNQDILSKAEFVYFQCSFQLQHRLLVFYGLPKVHKSPISLCHVVSNTNSFLAVFSIWLDQKMKDLLPLIKSYIKNSSAVISDLNELILPGSKDLYRRRYIYVQEYRYRHRTARR